jgi:hypothetical protein
VSETAEQEIEILVVMFETNSNLPAGFNDDRNGRSIVPLTRGYISINLDDAPTGNVQDRSCVSRQNESGTN